MIGNVRTAFLLLAIAGCDDPAPTRCAVQAEHVADACGDELLDWHECRDLTIGDTCERESAALHRCYAPLEPAGDAVAAAGCMVTGDEDPYCERALEQCRGGAP